MGRRAVLRRTPDTSVEARRGRPRFECARSVRHRAVGAAIVASIASVLPVYLVGAMAVQLRADLQLSASGLGAAAFCYFMTAALGSTVAGRLVERVGARRGLLAAGAGSALAMAGFAVTATNWPVALAFLALAGLANSVAHPAANLMLAQVVPEEHRGLGFGLKQAAIPAATLLGGLFVPLFALTIGWRWAFVAGAVLALVGMSLVRRCTGRARGPRDVARIRQNDVALRPLLVMSVAAGLGSAAALSVGTFYVDSTVASGVHPLWVGLLFAGGSAFGIATRIGVGVLADRRPTRHLLRVSTMFVGGAVGFLLLTTTWWPPLVLGTILVFGAGSGWQGLFIHSLVRQSPGAPAFATGVAQIMVSLGSAVGPPVFGRVVDTWSYDAAWTLSAALAIAAALTLLLGRRLALADRARRRVAPLEGIPA